MVNGSTVNPKGTLDSKIALLYLMHYALPHRQFPHSFHRKVRTNSSFFLFPARHGQSPVFFFFPVVSGTPKGRYIPGFPFIFLSRGGSPFIFPKEGTVCGSQFLFSPRMAQFFIAHPVSFFWQSVISRPQ